MSETPHASGKKKHRKADSDIDPEFQIAPMIDILLVLLVFFMSISSTEVLQANKEVNLPIAKDAKEAKDTKEGQVIINVTFTPINNTTAIDVDQKKYASPSELMTLLKNKVSGNPLVRVKIRADKEVKYEYMRQLLEAIGLAGVGNVTFSVVDKEANGGKSS
ncbi:MAG: biopolymer transporter ExbD [Verrucomicrobiaceae bacterium]|nr:MAG: biopolymer transporter ExbD [Verrucomicrobiaceae bacterium]